MEEILEDIPPELIAQLEQVREDEAQQSEENRRKLDELGKKIAKIRDEAVAHRRASGIEDIWREDEEYYEGADDLNRGTETFLKSRSLNGGLTSERENESTKCTAFFNITRQFVDSAASRARDILLPANDWNFAIKQTPVPELEEFKQESSQLLDMNGNPIAPVSEVSDALLKESAKKVEKAETRIKDWLTECGYKQEYGKVIDAAAKSGTGILKGPYPTRRVTRNHNNGTFELIEDIVPGSKYVSYWDFFPDPDCGESIHDGSYVFERDFMTARQLRDLRGLPGYIDEAVNKVLKEGPNKANDKEPNRKPKDDDRFEVWYFYGDIGKKDLEHLGEEFASEEGEDNAELEEEEDVEAYPAILVMVNDTVIKGHVSPLDSGAFPFDLMVWQRMEGCPWGIGVARQGRTAQKMVNSSCRALMDNMAISAVPMLAMMRKALIPADGSYDIAPGKLWYIKETETRTAQETIQAIVIPSMQVEIMNIIALGKQMMEDATGVSFLLQGQQGSAPDTVGGMQMLHVNASAMLRRIAFNADNSVTRPHIKRYYDDWLMVHGDESEKGDATIDALGSTALVERETQAMQLPQILQLALDPRYEKSPKKVFDEVLRAWRFDPGKFDMDEEEKQKLDEQMEQMQQAAQQQASIQMEAAKLKAQTDLQIAQMDNQTDLQKAKMDQDRDTIHIQAQTQRDQITYEARIQELQLKRELALLEYANTQKVTLDKIKADLAKEAIRTQTTKELASLEASADRLPKPPVEPPGQARKGKSYTE